VGCSLRARIALFFPTSFLLSPRIGVILLYSPASEFGVLTHPLQKLPNLGIRLRFREVVSARILVDGDDISRLWPGKVADHEESYTQPVKVFLDGFASL